MQGQKQAVIIHRVVDELKLKSLREINMEVRSFLSKKGSIKTEGYDMN